MPVTVTRLTPRFAARINGVDVPSSVDDEAWAEFAAFEEHSILVVQGAAAGRRGHRLQPPLRRAGNLAEREPGHGRAVRAPVRPRHQDRRGDPTKDPQMVLPAGTCSRAHRRPSSRLRCRPSARCCPRASCRPRAGPRSSRAAAPPTRRCPRTSGGAPTPPWPLHDFSWSRDQVRPALLHRGGASRVPAGAPPVVRVSPVNGRRNLFLGAHASHVEGLPVEEGRAFLRELRGPHERDPSSATATSGGRANLVHVGQPLRAPPRDPVRHHAAPAAEESSAPTVFGDPAEAVRAGR